ncbi:MAG: carboxypeptidase-like regulatory domain-containing protein [Verrucomicrobia bacterium]|nr:carboxypeptidase-like regulatory domain-containing protein [Cytophagales bacterium]
MISKFIKGEVKDAEENKPVVHASIRIKGTPMGTLSERNGRFTLPISPAITYQDTLEISSVGYIPAFYVVSSVIADQNLEVKLIPAQVMLNEVVITGKSSLIGIIKKVHDKIGSNYIQSPYSTQMLYKYSCRKNDSLELQELALLSFWDAEGFRRSNWESVVERKYLQIEKLKIDKIRTKNNISSLPNLWTIWTGDPILTKRNLLSEGTINSYELLLTDTLDYQNRTVYKINFTCTKPSAYTTPYAYPSPISYQGFLYIDVKNFAVVKYEAFTTWESQVLSKKSIIKRFFMKTPFQLTRTAHDVYEYEHLKGVYFLKYARNSSNYTINALDESKGYKQENKAEFLNISIEMTNPKMLKKNLLQTTTNVPIDEKFWDNYQFFLNNEFEKYENK